MSLLQALILGILQGLTEFLPISSTAHLILVPALLGWELEPEAVFVFDVLLQLGTVAAVVVYFAKDLWALARAMVSGLRAGQPLATAEARLGWLIGVATLPAVVVGLLLKEVVEGLHQDPRLVAGMLLLAAGLLFVVERYGKRTRQLDTLTWLDALIIGCTQVFALFPGVSRSAATISGGLFRGLDRPAAARFSFLMSIPVLGGAGVLAVKDLLEIPNFTTYLPSLALGFLAAAVVGFLTIHWLLGYLAQHSMAAFAWYRVVFGALCLIVLSLR